MVQVIDAPSDIAVSLARTRRATGECVLFAARQSGLAMMSEADGCWTTAFASLEPRPATTSVAVSPGDAGDGIVFAGVNGGILRSSDFARTWSPIPFAAPPPLVTCIACSPRFEQDGTVLAGTLEDGVFRSADRGLTWHAANLGLLDMTVLAIAMASTPSKEPTALLGAESGVFLSENGGRSWYDTMFPDAGGPVSAVALSPRFATDGLIIAGTDGAGLFRFRKCGEDWSPIGKDLASTTIIAVHIVESDSGVDPTVLVVTANGAFLSFDTGNSWQLRTSPLPADESIVAACSLDDSDPDSGLAIALENGAIHQV